MQHVSRWWTPAEVATALEMSTQTVRGYLRTGQLAAVQHNGRYYVPDWAVQPYLYPARLYPTERRGQEGQR